MEEQREHKEQVEQLQREVRESREESIQYREKSVQLQFWLDKKDEELGQL